MVNVFDDGIVVDGCWSKLINELIFPTNGDTERNGHNIPTPHGLHFDKPYASPYVPSSHGKHWELLLAPGEGL